MHAKDAILSLCKYDKMLHKLTINLVNVPKYGIIVLGFCYVEDI